LYLLYFTSFCLLNNEEKITQQSLLTSHVSAPSVVSREESKWTYAEESNEWIFCQFRTFNPGEVCKRFLAFANFCSVAVITCVYARKVHSSILGRSMHLVFYLQKIKT
jgi:hypothetical protein